MFYVLYSFIVLINASKATASVLVSGDRDNKERERIDGGLTSELANGHETDKAETDETRTEPPAMSVTVARGHQKSQVTRAIGAIYRLIAENDSTALTAHLEVIKSKFHDFEKAHDDVCLTLADEDDIEKNEQYFAAVEEDYIQAVIIWQAVHSVLFKSSAVEYQRGRNLTRWKI